MQENPPILRKHTIKCWEVEVWPLGLTLGWAVRKERPMRMSEKDAVADIKQMS